MVQIARNDFYGFTDWLKPKFRVVLHSMRLRYQNVTQ